MGWVSACLVVSWSQTPSKANTCANICPFQEDEMLPRCSPYISQTTSGPPERRGKFRKSVLCPQHCQTNCPSIPLLFLTPDSKRS